MLQYRDFWRECVVLSWKYKNSFTVVQGSFAESDFHTCSTERRLSEKSSFRAASSGRGTYIRFSRLCVVCVRGRER